MDIFEIDLKIKKDERSLSKKFKKSKSNKHITHITQTKSKKTKTFMQSINTDKMHVASRNQLQRYIEK
jgi:hypothetical protein